MLLSGLAQQRKIQPIATAPVRQSLPPMLARHAGAKFYCVNMRTVPGGEPMHEMLLRVTIDDSFVIQDILAATEHSPFEMCPAIAPNYKKLIGIKMGPGWRKAIRMEVGGTEGCTHLTELLFPMATVAMQTIWPSRSKRKQESDAKEKQPHGKRPIVLGTCHAWASDSPVVRENAPRYFTGGAAQNEKS